MTGTGVPPAQAGISVDQGFINFVSLGITSTSAPVPIMISNPGTAALVVSSIASSASDFIASHNCPNVGNGGVPPGGFCTANVSFSPKGIDRREAILTIQSNANTGTAFVSLAGTGVYSTADTTPNMFAFTTQTNVATNTLITSAPVAIQGINADTTISVSGGGGQYSVGCTGTYTSLTNTFPANPPMQTVCVRHTSAATSSTTITTTLFVGGVPGTFSSTTSASSTGFALTVIRLGSGTGSVSSTIPASPTISCGISCSATFNSGMVVTLVATPSGSSTFAGWSAGTGSANCTGTGTCQVAMSAMSSISASFNPSATVVPGAPTGVIAAPGNAQAIVSFAAPASDGGSPITGYAVLSSPVGGTDINAGTTSLNHIITGLTNGVTYTFIVIATNSVGDSGPSAPSNMATPLAPTSNLLLVQSRKTHGSAGPFNVDIDTSKTINQAVTVEPRDSRGGHTIVFQFNNAIASINSFNALGLSGPIGNLWVTRSGNSVTAYLASVPDNRRVTILLNGVNGTTNVATSLGFLVGDVNGTRSVNASDISRVKASFSQTINMSNYLLDLNLSGTINANDLAIVKARSGMVLP